MEARLATSLPSTSAASLVLDLADELWFSHSVVPFPSFSLSCLSPLFSSLFSNSPDPSTLLAQLMFSTICYSPRDCPAYCAYCGYPSKDEVIPYFAPGHGEGGDIYSFTCYGKVENAVPRYGKTKDAHLASSCGEDAHPPCNDGENSENAIMIAEKQDMAVKVALTDVPSNLDAEDALSGIQDVAALLRDQHHQRKDIHYNWRQDMLDVVLPESWPRGAQPLQDRKESKSVGNVETSVGSSKRGGSRQRGTTGTASHVAKGVAKRRQV